MTFEEERIEKMEKALMDINKESRVLYGIKEKIIAMMDAAEAAIASILTVTCPL